MSVNWNVVADAAMHSQSYAREGNSTNLIVLGISDLGN